MKPNPLVLYPVRAPASAGVPTLFCHPPARNCNADSSVYYAAAASAVSGEGLMYRWKVGLAPAEPAYRKRRRRALAAERKARRRQRGFTTGLSRSERSACTTSVPLERGRALIVILLLSLGLWAMIWTAVALAVSALG